MDEKKYACLLISDFNIQNLADMLRQGGTPPVQPLVAPYGQVMQTLLGHDSECWKQEPDAAVVWTLPDMDQPWFS